MDRPIKGGPEGRDLPPITGPHRVSRRIEWGDCDSAGITYTPKNLEFAVEAVSEVFTEVLGLSWYRLNKERDIGQPVVRAEVDFLSPLRPDDRLHQDVILEAVGNSSLTWRVEGVNDEGVPCYRARLVACFVDELTMRPRQVPEFYRERIMAYLEASKDR